MRFWDDAFIPAKRWPRTPGRGVSYLRRPIGIKQAVIFALYDSAESNVD
jgi:hypothetical protein